MKRLFVFMFTVIIITVFTGCNEKTPVKNAKANLDSAFECNMKIVYDDSEFDGKLKRMGHGAWEAEFNSPETLSGVKLSFLNGDVTASYKGLSFTVPKSALPLKSILSNLMTVVDELSVLDELECTVKDGMMIVEGDVEQGPYTLKIDEKTGWISEFEMKNVNTKMTFSDMVITDDDIQISGMTSETTAQPVSDVLETSAVQSDTSTAPAE